MLHDLHGQGVLVVGVADVSADVLLIGALVDKALSLKENEVSVN